MGDVRKPSEAVRLALAGGLPAEISREELIELMGNSQPSKHYKPDQGWTREARPLLDLWEARGTFDVRQGLVERVNLRKWQRKPKTGVIAESRELLTSYEEQLRTFQGLPDWFPVLEVEQGTYQAIEVEAVARSWSEIPESLRTEPLEAWIRAQLPSFDPEGTNSAPLEASPPVAAGEQLTGLKAAALFAALTDHGRLDISNPGGRRLGAPQQDLLKNKKFVAACLVLKATCNGQGNLYDLSKAKAWLVENGYRFPVKTGTGRT